MLMAGLIITAVEKIGVLVHIFHTATHRDFGDFRDSRRSS